MIKAVAKFLASGFYSGFFPFAPGTVGTVVAIPLAYLLSLTPPGVNVAVVLITIIAGSPLCGIAAKEFGAKDPGFIVLDEIAGFFVSTLFLEPSISTYLAAFFLFRLFDIIKPPPANWLDRWNGGGWSVMLDDIAAGLMTRGVLAIPFVAGLI